jgi:hypothetical protein
VIALMLTVELLHFSPESSRAAAWFKALLNAAPKADVRVVQTKRLEGSSDVLLLWGPGAPSRFGPMRAQVERGGRVLCCDLAYWDRTRKVRISIDSAHPQAWVMRREWPADRVDADGIRVESAWNPDGPVLVAGIGRKARTQYGSSVVEAWDAQMVRDAARYGRQVQYRRKQADAPVPAGAVLASDRPIDDVLRGASMLVTWHSNVAVDAIRMGIPVVCRDGAAAALCPSELPETVAPLDPSVRAQFLANLAWFQWLPSEAEDFWRWVPEVLA